MFSPIKYLIVFSLLSMAASVTVSAAPLSVPNDHAHETLREQERQEQLREQHEHQPDVHLQKEPNLETSSQFPEQESPCFQIEQIVLVGKESEKFNLLLNGKLNHE